MQTIAISRQPVELFKILKFAGLTGSGGEAKYLIEQGQVLVNNEVETRKRRKIVVGDNITFDEQTFTIVAE